MQVSSRDVNFAELRLNFDAVAPQLFAVRMARNRLI
jgi:hypothetical protein